MLTVLVAVLGEDFFVWLLVHRRKGRYSSMGCQIPEAAVEDEAGVPET